MNMPLRLVGEVIASILPTTDSKAETNELTFPRADVRGILTGLESPAGSDGQLNGTNQLVSWWQNQQNQQKERTGYTLLLETQSHAYHTGFHPGSRLMASGKWGGSGANFPHEVGVWQHVVCVRDADRRTLRFMNG